MTGTRLTITADDYGLTDATSRAIIDVHERGIVTATSVLAVAPGIDRRLRWLEDSPALCVGVHLALVGEDPPLLSAREIPTLVDRRGAFRSSWRHLLPVLAAGRVDPQDVRRELAAQIAVVTEHTHPTHLDSHQHLHLWPSVAKVVIKLAIDQAIGTVRVPRGTHGLRARGVGVLARRLSASLDDAGLAHPERFVGLDEAGRWDAKTLIDVLQRLALGEGSVECNVHPGAIDDPDRSRFRWGYGWGVEANALVDPAVRRAVDRLGFELVGP